ncbi:MAG TPA: fibronectin type III domain-containing protein, partial [Thermoanaerobaculia bacterium]
MSRWGFGCALAALLCALPAAATTIVRVADPDLVAQAPLVVVAEVDARGPAASGAAATDYRFSVERVLKGTVGPELTVTVPGGMGRDGLTRRVYGAPSFAPGERAILFLEPLAGGDYRILHLMQGAFREVRREGRSLALRNLADVAEVRLDGGTVESAPAEAAEPVRDFEAFARWIGDAARGAAPAADYRVALPAAEEGPGRVAAPFTLFRDEDDDTLLRWFEFDTGGSVPWLFATGGQPGVPGGGQADFQAALQAWNADAQTPIRLVFTGQSAPSPFNEFDDKNLILLNDPFDELTDLGPSCSGTLALGGSAYRQIARTFRGQTYYPFEEGDIVVNDGLECFFVESPNARKAAEELFGHELGHTIGIDHSCGDNDGTDPGCSNALLSDALMRAFIHDDGRGARLNSDDLAAARALYAQGPSTPGSVPTAPSNLTAVAVSASEIELAWQDNSANETLFAVEVSLLGGSFVEVGTVPANTAGAIVENLAPATGYLFRVRARNGVGTS